ncbi:MAN1B1 [Symbiodinium sp. CCMP2592]|nr:MAN1B1 [Symbiodinium sp. CCMP2592]
MSVPCELYLVRAVPVATGPLRCRQRRHWVEAEAVAEAEQYLAEESELARRQADKTHSRNSAGFWLFLPFVWHLGTQPQKALSMMRHVWRNYEKRAFAKDELRPVSGTGQDSWGGIGQTLVDAMDTLWLMGFRKEFDRAAAWVEKSLSFAHDLNVNLFETTIRHLGGLLSAFALSGRPGLLAKAVDLGDRLIQAFPSIPAIPSPAPPAPAKGDTTTGWTDDVKKLLQQVGVPQNTLDTVLGKEVKTAPASLPSSDVNLKTGETKNLAGFVSLAEAYVPMEWKYLTALTGNCTYSRAQDQVLRTLNASLDLQNRGLGAILLRSDGSTFASPENRISLGSRGDSFYEYLLKDSLFAGEHADPLARTLWNSFRRKLPELLVEVDPQPAASRRKRRRSPKEEVPRGFAGSLGGWYESWREWPTPWLFVKELSASHTIPKMDHLICFLPGAIALEVLHEQKRNDRKSKVDLRLAHKLVETCVHTYWRTASDLAPEITRFNAFGLVDDLGSMHNILRPETIESLFVLWRTTKKQIYRNWGQRMLCAFYRSKTPFGFASLHNVNHPVKKRDDMPSFFVAETLKYLFLLFSDDAILPLDQFVLGTEAHPVPLLQTLRSSWPCELLTLPKAFAEVEQVPEESESEATEPSQPVLEPVPPSDTTTATPSSKAQESGRGRERF